MNKLFILIIILIIILTYILHCKNIKENLTQHKEQKQIIEKKYFSNKKHRVAVCFFGLTRSLDYTLDSIKKNILSPLEQSNIEYDIILHSYNLKSIKSKRSGENNKLNTQEWNKLNPDYVKIDNQDEFDKSYNYEYIKSFGDAWDTNFENTINLIRQLNSLKNVWKLAETSKSTYDSYLFIRPDLKYTTKLDINQVKEASTQINSIYIPTWHNWDGVNDRMALGCYNTIKIYANRLDNISDYLETTKNPLHAEKFLKFLLNKYNIEIKELNLIGKRVRSNGKIPSIDQKL